MTLHWKSTFRRLAGKATLVAVSAAAVLGTAAGPGRGRARRRRRRAAAGRRRHARRPGRVPVDGAAVDGLRRRAVHPAARADRGPLRATATGANTGITATLGAVDLQDPARITGPLQLRLPGAGLQQPVRRRLGADPARAGRSTGSRRCAVATTTALRQRHVHRRRLGRGGRGRRAAAVPAEGRGAVHRRRPVRQSAYYATWCRPRRSAPATGTTAASTPARATPAARCSAATTPASGSRSASRAGATAAPGRRTRACTARRATFASAIAAAAADLGGGTPTPTCATQANTSRVSIPDAGAAINSPVTIAGCTGAASSSSKVEVTSPTPTGVTCMIDLVAPDGTRLPAEEHVERATRPTT